MEKADEVRAMYTQRKGMGLEKEERNEVQKKKKKKKKREK